MEVLFKYLKHNNPAIRFAAIGLMCSINPADPVFHQTIAMALDYTSSDFWQDRQRSTVVSALERIQPTDTKTLDILVNFLSHEKSGVRLSAVEALSKIKMSYPLIDFSLSKALEKDPDSNIRAQSAIVFGEKGTKDTGIHLTLARALLDSDEFVRRCVVIALGKLQPTDPGVLNFITNLLKHQDSKIRAAAVQALGRIKPVNPVIHYALTQSLKDSDAQVRIASTDAIGMLPSVDEKNLVWILELLKSENPDIRSSAIFTLGKIKLKDQRILDALVRAVDDPDAGVTQSVVKVLRSMKPRDSVSVLALLDLLNKLDFDVVKEAYLGLFEMRPLSVPEPRKFAGFYLEYGGNKVVFLESGLKKLKENHSQILKSIPKMRGYIFERCVHPSADPIPDDLLEKILETLLKSYTDTESSPEMDLSS